MQPSTSRAPPSGFNVAQRKTQQTVLEAEWFKAAVAEPTGMVTQLEVLFNNEIFGENDNLDQNVQNMQNLTMLQERLQLNEISQVLQKIGDGAGLSDDDFFHLTCHIDPVL